MVAQNQGRKENTFWCKRCKSEGKMFWKTFATFLIVGCVTLIAQQINNEKIVLPKEAENFIQSNNNYDLWSHKGTRTDLAPTFEQNKAQENKNICEPSEKVKMIYENAWQMQNSEYGIPLVQTVVNAEVLKIANEEWDKECQNQKNNTVETRTVWGSSK